MGTLFGPIIVDPSDPRMGSGSCTDVSATGKIGKFRFELIGGSVSNSGGAEAVLDGAGEARAQPAERAK